MMIKYEYIIKTIQSNCIHQYSFLYGDLNGASDLLEVFLDCLMSQKMKNRFFWDGTPFDITTYLMLQYHSFGGLDGYDFGLISYESLLGMQSEGPWFESAPKH